jgi:hypothetical protein
MWNELHVFYEPFYIYFLGNSGKKFIIICNSCIIEYYGFGMPFAYKEAMTGIVKHIRNVIKFAFTDEYFPDELMSQHCYIL